MSQQLNKKFKRFGTGETKLETIGSRNKEMNEIN